MITSDMHSPAINTPRPICVVRGGRKTRTPGVPTANGGPPTNPPRAADETPLGGTALRAPGRQSQHPERRGSILDTPQSAPGFDRERENALPGTTAHRQPHYKAPAVALQAGDDRGLQYPDGHRPNAQKPQLRDGTAGRLQGGPTAMAPLPTATHETGSPGGKLGTDSLRSLTAAEETVESAVNETESGFQLTLPPLFTDLPDGLLSFAATRVYPD